MIDLSRGELTTGPTQASEVLEIQRRRIERLVPLLQALWRSQRSQEHCSALHGVE